MANGPLVRGRWAVLAAVCATTLLSVASPARAEDLVITIPAEGIKLDELLTSLGIAENKVIVWTGDDKRIPSQVIKTTGNLRAPRERLFETVRALLTLQEIILIPVGPKGYEIYVAKWAQELGQASILRNKPEYVELTDENVDYYSNQDGLYLATAIKVQNLENLRDARTALQRLSTNQQNLGSIQEVPAARAFVVTDFAPNVVAIYRLLKQMDVQPDGKKVKQVYIRLENSLAEDIEPIISDLFTGRQRLTSNQPNQQGGGDVFDPEPRVIADARTNQIIVYATEEDIQEILQLVKHLDESIRWVTQRVHVVRLNNLEAAETAEVLRALIEGTTLFGASSGSTFSGTSSSRTRSTGGNRSQPGGRVATAPRPATGAAPGGASPEQQEKPTVVAEEASNSLIIAASADQFEDLKLILAEIDVRKKQVMIEAALIELSLDDSYRFAIEIAGLDPNGLDAHAGPSLFGGTNFGLTTFADRDGDGLFTDRVPPFVQDGGSAPTGAIGGIFAAGQVPLIYRALNTIKKTRVLQLPSIVTSDNEEATIQVLDEQATTDNTTTTGGVSTGGFGGFQEAGTTLSISPHIAGDNYLLLNITLEVSGFLGEPKTIGNSQIPADKFRRNIRTAVTIPDRHTVVLGGLIGNTQRDEVDQVPFLGQLPVIGELFKGTNKRNLKTNLFLFVTPTILKATDRDFADFDALTCLRKQKADELIGQIDIPFANFRNCPNSNGCLVDPATGVLRGSGSASDRLDHLGALEYTRFQGVDPNRLKAEAMARRRAMESGKAPARSVTPAPTIPSGSGTLFLPPAPETPPTRR